jgi:triosephosphate isomerase
MENRRPLIAGNWKMFKTCLEAVETARQLVELIADNTTVDVMIAPTFTSLMPVSDVVKGSCVALGAQNLFWEPKGPIQVKYHRPCSYQPDAVML